MLGKSQRKMPHTENVKTAQCYEQQRGGVALEYILVSTFITISGMVIIGIASQIIKEKVYHISKKLDLNLEEINWNPFTEE